jgi:outer membrane lipoprotein-sorting protein
MNSNTISKAALVVLLTAGICKATECTKPCVPDEAQQTAQCAQPKTDPVDDVLKQLNDKTIELQSYEGQLEYKFTQPLLESEALRKGILYYAKFGEKSKLRINFLTLKQDDEEEQKYLEDYIFDGTWLTQISYEIKSAKKYQLAEPNKPVDAFDVASRNIPLLGFTKIENLKKQFEITLVEQKEDKPVTFFQLHLKVKPNSTYKDDYASLDFWIDKKLGLPTKVVALSPEEDIYEIKFLNPKTNRKINAKAFDFKIPKDFGEPEIVPLEKKKDENGL